jgi:ABC-type glycerol-3-phosphate transport system permease component
MTSRVANPQKHTARGALTVFVMLIVALIYIYPVVLMVINSLKPFKEVLTNAFQLCLRHREDGVLPPVLE